MFLYSLTMSLLMQLSKHKLKLYRQWKVSCGVMSIRGSRSRESHTSGPANEYGKQRQDPGARRWNCSAQRLRINSNEPLARRLRSSSLASSPSMLWRKRRCVIFRFFLFARPTRKATDGGIERQNNGQQQSDQREVVASWYAINCKIIE